MSSSMFITNHDLLPSLSAAIARKIFLPAVVALLLLAGAGKATAYTCTITPGAENIAFGQVNIQPSAAIGDTLASTTRLLTVTCPATTNGVAPSYPLAFITDGTWETTSLADVWQSNLSGIGVRLTSTTISPLTGTTTMVVSNSSTTACTTPFGAMGNPVCRLGPYQVSSSAFTLNISLKIDLVKTAATLGTQTLSAYVVGPFCVAPTTSPLAMIPSARTITGGGTTFVPSTCTRTSPDPLVVTLPALAAAKLGSPGMTGGDQTFTLDFNCGAASRVLMTMTDATTGSNNTSQLTLSPDSTATGVKLQVLYNGVPIVFNPDSQAAGIAVGTSIGANQPFSIPLTVRYISTGTATPGTVNATAWYTLSYQ